MAKTTVGRPSAKPQKPTTTTRVRLGELFRAESSVFYLIAGSTMALVVFGLIMVMDSSSVTSHLDGEGFTGLFLKQLLFAAGGIPLMLLMSRLPLTFWKKSGRLFGLRRPKRQKRSVTKCPPLNSMAIWCILPPLNIILVFIPHLLERRIF